MALQIQRRTDSEQKAQIKHRKSSRGTKENMKLANGQIRRNPELDQLGR